METPGKSRAVIVALGILLSRLAGLAREKALAWVFGVSAHADVLRFAFRAPNLLQNLLGEQTLSATFIPAYSRLLAAGKPEDAGRFAGAIFSLLVAATSALVLLGVVFAPFWVPIFLPGLLTDAAQVAAGKLAVDRLALTIKAVRILLPMTGILVLSAWALGILNSHRRFFLPYAAPVLWNSAIMAALFWAVGRSGLPVPQSPTADVYDSWVLAVCWGGLVGGVLQFAVQLPQVWRLLRGFRLEGSLRTALAVPGVRPALTTLGPALAGRGVVQLSLYLDQFLASFLKVGAASAIGWAGLLASLPQSVFGASVAAAELPELARSAEQDPLPQLTTRLDRGLRQIAVVICPAVVGFWLFGFLVAALVFQGGRYTPQDNWLISAVLWGYTLGLLASTCSRLLQNTFFALQDTRTPAQVALVRLFSSAVLGASLMLWFDHFTVAQIFAVPGGHLHLGAVGLSLSAGLASWWELWRLQRALQARLPGFALPIRHFGQRLGLALLAALPALILWWLLRHLDALPQALAVLPVYGLTYLAIARWQRWPELDLWLGRPRR